MPNKGAVVVGQWLERQPTSQGVVSSDPVGCIEILVYTCVY